jgi:adenylate cyclase
MPRLIIGRPGQPPRVFELPDGRPTGIGRAESNNLILSDSSVSRRHAVLTPAEGHWQIEDQASSNGVRVNGVLVERAILKRGDEVTLGAYTLRFEEFDAPDLLTQATVALPPRLAQTLYQAAQGEILAKPVAPSTSSLSAAERRTDHAQRVRFLEHEYRLLTLLYRVGRALDELDAVEDVTHRVLETVLEIEGVERGYAMLLDEISIRAADFSKGQYGFLPAIIRYRNQPRAGTQPPVILSQSIIRQVVEVGVPLLVTDARADERFTDSKSIALSGIQSAMCAPLRSRDHLFGLLYVDNLSRTGIFSNEDMNVFTVIATQAGLAIDRTYARMEAARQALQRSALERFLSPSIARKIMTEAADLCLGGENQTITILFADLREFTSLAETMRPEKVVEILNQYFDAMTGLVFANGGTLDKYLGDGLMCLFGAPFAGENDALAATRTAIEMQIRLAQLNQTSSRAPLRMGIGINTGPAVVGYLGSARRMDYTAVGDAVNVAARLTAQARADQIVVSAATHAQVSNQIPARRLAPMTAKGRVSPIDVYEVAWQGFLLRNDAAQALPVAPDTKV